MNAPTSPPIPRRPPEVVMRLSRLGSFHQSRLSFMRVLLRRMASEGWQITRPRFEIDGKGEGVAVYTAAGPERSYSLVAFAHDLPDHLRSDRVIAEAWDATFALFDGVPDQADIDRLRANVPKQEAGRVSERELTLSRANRSVRLWSHVVNALAAGQQPDAAEIDKVGYLMRTTAVYGSGKFGASDYSAIADRAEMAVPFQAEMLTVFLIRGFVRDLVEHMAASQGGADAVRLAPDLAERLGIGNSTGLGMAPFLIRHPVLINNWIMAREEAIARVRAVQDAAPEAVSLFSQCLSGLRASAETWRSEHPAQITKNRALCADLALLSEQVSALSGALPWDRLIRWAERNLSEEGQEALASLMLEPYPDLVDGLACCMSDPGSAPRLDGQQTVAATRALLWAQFGWAFETDWAETDAHARVWYVSEEKLEPRLGERCEEPLSDYEHPLAPGRDAVAAERMLADWPNDAAVATCLLAHPEHRHVIHRAQICARAPYGEIRDNTIAATMLPIDLLRAKLSFFGATRFDPRSDRWVRIAMFAGAPYPETLAPETADLWVYPGVT